MPTHTTTSTTSMRSTTVSRYEKLLRERITAGESMIDHLCHPEARADAVAAFKRTERLDLRLSSYRRFPNDFVERVMPAEDARWHAMPSTPAGHQAQPCTLCIDSSRLAVSTVAMTTAPVAA